MGLKSHAPQTIQSSQKVDGNQRRPWKSDRWQSASKACECCGKRFYPWVKSMADGSLRIQKEKLWMKQRFCSISCSKIHSNCMRSKEVRTKVSATMKAKGHHPRMRGGNGKITIPQMRLLELLGVGWIAEQAVPVTGFKALKLPKNLKIDIAHPKKMIAIELDGHSHQSPNRRLQDSRKTVYLAQNGWFVFRITNQRADELSSTCTSPDILLTLLTAHLFITAT